MLDARVAAAIADVFGVDPSGVTPESSPENISDWDSIGHFKLILQLEEMFGIRFPAGEIGSLRTAGKIQDTLARMKVLG